MSKFGDLKAQKTPNFRHFENKILHLTIFRPKNNHWSLPTSCVDIVIASCKVLPN